MKTSILNQNGVSEEMVDLLGRLIELIPWPDRRLAMGDVTVSLLNGKHRVSEDVFGWNRSAVELGIHEFQTGIVCVNDLSNRRKPKTEDKFPKLMTAIHHMMEPQTQAEPRLRTTLLYTHMTASNVHKGLVKKGWKTLPAVRTISNILNRHGYRLRSVEKTKVEKKHKKQTPSLRISVR